MWLKLIISKLEPNEAGWARQMISLGVSHTHTHTHTNTHARTHTRARTHIHRGEAKQKWWSIIIACIWSIKVSPGRCGSGGEGCWRSLLTGVTMANHGRFPARETDKQPGWPDWEGPTVPGGELLFLQSGWDLSVSQHVGRCTKGVLDQGNAVLLTANRNVRNDFSYLPWVEQTFLISWQSLPKVF